MMQTSHLGEFNNISYLGRLNAVRVIQIDFISDHIGGRWGHDLRGSVGVVFKVGR